MVIYSLSRKVMANFLIYIFLTFFLICTLEFGVRLFFPLQNPEICMDCYPLVPHKIYGLFHEPSSTHHPTKYCNGHLCYKVQTSFDRYGRRIVGNERKSKNHLLMLGCSFTAGEGLNDQDTLAHFLNESVDAQTYNYATGGMGASHALTVLRNKKIVDEVEQKKGLAIYVFLDFHRDRESLSSHNELLSYFPAYIKTADQQLVSYPSQKLTYPLRAKLYELYYFLKDHSRILSLLNRNFAVNSQKENFDLNLSIILAAKKEYESKFQGKFIVVGHPNNTSNNAQFNDFLKANNIPFHQISIDRKETQEYAVCDCDAHPNGLLNKIFAEKLTPLLNDELNRQRP
jgi:hypothetical protein